MLPVFLARGAPDLVRLRAEPIPALDLWLILHADLQRCGRVRAVVEHLAAVVAGADLLTC